MPRFRVFNRISAERLLWILTIVVIALSTYELGVFWGTGNNITPSLSSSFTYTIGTDDAGNYWAVRSDGSVQFRSTDAYTVIQSAINATSTSTCGHIAVQAGTYLISHAILLYRYCLLEGESTGGTTFIQGYDGDVIDFIARPGDGNTVPGFQTVEHITIFGNQALYPSGFGIRDVNFSDTSVLFCYIDHMPQDAVRLDGGFYHRVENNWLESSKGNGLYIASGVARSFVIGNTIYDNKNDGVYLAGDQAQISNNVIFYNGANGLEVVGTHGRYIEIFGNDFSQNGQAVFNSYHHIKLNTAGQIAIVGNTFISDANLAEPLWLFSPVNVTVVGNHFDTPGASGWIFAGGTLNGLTVIDNPSLNPVGKIVNPFRVSPAYGNVITPWGGESSVPTRNTSYSVVGTPLRITCTGGTEVNITITDRAGNVLVTGLTQLSSEYSSISIGYEINFGGFSVPPNVTVFGS